MCWDVYISNTESAASNMTRIHEVIIEDTRGRDHTRVGLEMYHVETNSVRRRAWTFESLMSL